MPKGSSQFIQKTIAAVSLGAGYLLTYSTVFAAAGKIEAPAGSLNTNVDPTAIPNFILNGVFMVGAFLAILYLMYGGIRWMTSRGDKVAVEAARRHIVAAIIGLVVVITAFFTVNVVFKLAGSKNPLDPNNFKLPTIDDTNTTP